MVAFKGKKKRKYIVIAVVIVAIVFLFVNAGRFLVVSQEPVKADVIIVLGGDNILRTDYGVKLLQKGYSDKIMFTGGTTSKKRIRVEAEEMRKRALKLGVANDKIILEDKAISTYENAIFSKDIVLNKGYKSAIVVTSDYHMRRSSLVFNKAFRKSGVKLTFCSVEDVRFKPKKWFMDKTSRSITALEYKKLIGYFILGRL